MMNQANKFETPAGLCPRMNVHVKYDRKRFDRVYMEVKSDESFLLSMISHHERALLSSQYMLSRIADSKFQPFLKGIIDGQTKEVAMMKMTDKNILYR